MTNQSPSRRLNSIDFMRGLVIVIMAIDHTRDLLHTTGMAQDPLDLATTTPWLFMTRWVTHLCAPVFVFLAGASAYLALQSQQDLTKTKRFLRSRGLLLILLEVTVIGFGIWFDVYFRTVLFQVIFAIGMGLFILSFLLRVPARIIGITGLVIIAFHNLSSWVNFGDNVFGFIWTLLFEGGFFKMTADRALMIAYPVIPWLGILLFGFGFGSVFEMEQDKRRRTLLISGCMAFAVFIVLRSLNIYGDPAQWSTQSSGLHSFFSFIKVSKYPPSFLYTAITLAIMFFLLWVADDKTNDFARFFVTYGRVPLFFYIIHWYLIHLSMFIMIRVQGVKWEEMPLGMMQFGRPATGVGIALPYVYVFWIALILFMYPLCLWYGKCKAKNPDKKLLKYL